MKDYLMRWWLLLRSVEDCNGLGALGIGLCALLAVFIGGAAVLLYGWAWWLEVVPGLMSLFFLVIKRGK